MRKVITFSERYRPAIWTALASTLLLAIIGGPPMDMGGPAPLLASITVFWGTVVVIMCRRPQNPTSLDLALIRWAFLPLVIGFQFAIHFVWHWRRLV